MRHALVTLWIGLAATACFHLPPPQAPRPAVTIEASLGRTLDAAAAEFASLGITPTAIDRGSGRLTAEQHYSGTAADHANNVFADCGGMTGLANLAPSFASYTIIVRGDSARATLIVTAAWYNDRGKTPYACASTGLWETAFEAHVKERVARR